MDFIGPEHDWLFAVLCSFAESALWPTLERLEVLAVQHYIDRESDRRQPRFRDYLEGLAFNVEFVAADLPMYMEALRHYIDERERASVALRLARFVFRVA